MSVAPERRQGNAVALPVDRSTQEFLELQLKIKTFRDQLPIYYRFKIILETFWAAIILAVALVPMFLIAAVILLRMGRPIFFKQLRVGQNGIPFNAYKFRTMRRNAPRVVDVGFVQLQKIRDDLRVDGRIGRFLRKYKWDELPQLWNVVKGDMLLIGPRPYLIEENFVIPKEQLARFSIRPGISGVWQVSGNVHIKTQEKVLIDYNYVNNISFVTDVSLVIGTFKVLISGEK